MSSPGMSTERSREATATNTAVAGTVQPIVSDLSPKVGLNARARNGDTYRIQPDPHFGRILAAYGGIFVAGSLAWGMIVDKFRPDHWDYLGAAICLIGVADMMYAPRT